MLDLQNVKDKCKDSFIDYEDLQFTKLGSM
jgi:hypothetical protein